MIIEGYAFKANESELSSKRRERSCELQHLLPSLQLEKNPSYGRTFFTGVLTDDTKSLSEFDIACMIDSFCFGGEVVKSGKTFRGPYWID